MVVTFEKIPYCAVVDHISIGWGSSSSLGSTPTCRRAQERIYYCSMGSSSTFEDAAKSKLVGHSGLAPPPFWLRRVKLWACLVQLFSDQLF
jgi:hypothetical protein